MTVGLVIGSVLAQETPLGAAYFLDPKVIASFVMWAVYVVLLFVRRTAGLRGRRAAYLSGAVFLVMMAVWAANVIQPGSQVRSAMTLALIGVNHKTAPIEVRERIAISREELPETTRALAAVPGVTECMIVSTCNRVEMLAAVESPGDRSCRLSCIGTSASTPRCWLRTSTSIATRRPCAISSAWPPAWTRWWWASRRFWAR